MRACSWEKARYKTSTERIVGAQASAVSRVVVKLILSDRARSVSSEYLKETTGPRTRRVISQFCEGATDRWKRKSLRCALYPIWAQGPYAMP